jgi:diguanylate cyclase (GGDEF)-like protein
LKVLLIDDDAVDRAATKRALQREGAGYEFVEAATAAEGIDLYRWTPYDVVLVDYRLPDSDGLQTLHALRRSPEFQAAIVILTGQDDEALAERCLEEGAQDFILKSELGSRHIGRALKQARHRFRLEETVHRHHTELRTLAEHDPLTGLSNRLYFDSSLRSAMPLALRHGEPLALMLLDVDEFKYVNDSYGHDIGDRFLREVSSRLQGALRAGDLLCRLGGDEFAVLAHQFASEEQSLYLAQRILDTMRRPIHLAGADMTCTVSIGVACYPSSAFSAEELMKHADLAMYKSKRSGRNRASFYSGDLNAHAVRRVTLEQELRAALAAGQFEVRYQPQFGPTGGIVAAEALLRWRHPVHGLVGPQYFLDIAEDCGLVVPIGAWVLMEACDQAAAWRRAGWSAGEPPMVSVNLSGVQLRNEDIVELVDIALEKSGLDPTALELEITENAIVEAPGRASNILDQLSSRGTSIALDDFGTGFSSLSHLRLFPISVLKIDKSFLQGAMLEAREESLFRSVIMMARNIDLETVVEGVETCAQAELARRHGADRLQGFLFAHALPPGEFEQLLRSAA